MFCVQLAGVLIAVEARYAFTERLCVDYIVDASPNECDFAVSATPEEVAAENDEGAFSLAYCESLALYRKICTRMLEYDAFLFHAAVISYAGRGFAFAAKSGTGKSTHIAQWIRALGDNVTVVNGDKPIVRWQSGEGSTAEAGAVPDKTPDGQHTDTSCDRPSGTFVAYGTPYNGKEGWGQNASVPLRAVCFIERCQPGETDRLSRLEDDREIIARLANQVLLPKDPVLALRQLELLDRLMGNVPFYVLRCTPTPAAFDAAFRMTLCDNETESLRFKEGSKHED